MFLFNLSLAEFMALFSIASSVVIALYLLDRSRRKVIVATLRFWSAARRPVNSPTQRRIRQWPSLLMQLAALGCLLLAIAQLRWGSRDAVGRDHVLILDTSAWMSARGADGVPLFEQARAQALAYLRVIPASDRLLILRADALATPLTSFDTDHAKLEQALRSAQPGESGLDLSQALDYARLLQQRSGRPPGEIIYAGAGRTQAAEALSAPTNLRLLPVKTRPDNVGMRRIGLRRSATDAELWHVLVSVRNYGGRPQEAEVAIQFGRAPAGFRRIPLAPGEEREASFELRTRAAGLLEARLRSGGNGLVSDDRAVLELPALAWIPVEVCSDQPQQLRPLLDAHPNLQMQFRSPFECRNGQEGGIVIYDQFIPSAAPQAGAVYLNPPSAGSPAPVRASVSNTRLEKWLAGHAIAAGMRRQDLLLDSARVFEAPAGCAAVAETEQGPVLVACSPADQPKRVVLGFHPMSASLRYELAVPLIFANILRWMQPQGFPPSELVASGVGHVSVPVSSDADPARLSVTAEDGAALPFSVHNGAVRFLSARAGKVRVKEANRESIHSLVLPEIPEQVWDAPAQLRRGLPGRVLSSASSRDLWRWLALLGGLLLLAEWLLFAPGPSGTRWPGFPVRFPGKGVEQTSMRRAS
ncbi:MAG: VWA domain-containing protein [Acidimicrobiia bacterium]|nr:VWA domain-containing protein [Acidimicrobiia bacterium]